MTFDELTLHNFGSYRGRQKLVLTPTAPDKPVVLIGGLNGSGKTTILDALQLVLYGKHAHRSSGDGVAYEEFLRRGIHRGVPAAEGAALELRFHHVIEASERSYVIHRSWSETGSAVRERLEVWRDGIFDRALTELWAEHVETLMPLSVSQLFLFDGEKIEMLADLGTSQVVLREGVNALLGLDLVDQLAADLVLLERRKRSTSVGEERREGRSEETATEEKLLELREGVYQRLGAASNRRRELETQLKKIDERFRRAGGVALEQSTELLARRESIGRRSEEVTRELVELAGGVAPLALVRTLLEEAMVEGRREAEMDRSRRLLTLILERDTMVIEQLRAAGVPEEHVTVLGAVLARDRARRDVRDSEKGYLRLSEDSCKSIETVAQMELPLSLGQIQQHLSELEVLEAQANQIERQVEAAPEPSALKQIVEERETCRRLLAEATGQIQALETEWRRLKDEIDRRTGEGLERAREAAGTGRILLYSARVRGTLQRFRLEKLRLHLERLGSLICEGFQTLLHKEHLISAVKIDPDTFSLLLHGPDGAPMEAERLSAGERQLLAVSVLWGLARASGRRLPVVIDTPLGRLDSVHRANIVERYFPKASHQVILLSTDEEIVGEYEALIAPWVGRSYRLDFDRALNRTMVNTGYLAESISNARAS